MSELYRIYGDSLIVLIVKRNLFKESIKSNISFIFIKKEFIQEKRIE